MLGVGLLDSGGATEPGVSGDCGDRDSEGDVEFGVILKFGSTKGTPGGPNGGGGDVTASSLL